VAHTGHFAAHTGHFAAHTGHFAASRLRYSVISAIAWAPSSGLAAARWVVFTFLALGPVT